LRRARTRPTEPGRTTPEVRKRATAIDVRGMPSGSTSAATSRGPAAPSDGVKRIRPLLRAVAPIGRSMPLATSVKTIRWPGMRRARNRRTRDALPPVTRADTSGSGTAFAVEIPITVLDPPSTETVQSPPLGWRTSR
jgi:hypothetical protein